MTSTVRNCDRPQGFTLLEIVMVLVIAGIVMGGAVGLMTYSSDERVLRNASGEIELLAKRARTTAVLLQTPYALEFREGIVKLMPLAQAGRDERRTLKGRPIGGETAASEGGGERWEYKLEGGMEVSVRRWNSSAWLGTRKNAAHVWRFDPDGLCEPISVRLALDQSWAEDSYNPLTASVREKLVEIR